MRKSTPAINMFQPVMVLSLWGSLHLKCHMCIDNKNSECVWYMVAKSKAKSVFC